MKRLFKRLCYELAMTFSNKDSLISAKRIERFISYTLATSILACFACLKLACVQCVAGLDSSSIILISGTLYGYGAFNTIAGITETKKQDGENN